MPVTALSIRAPSALSEPRICGIDQPPADVGADRDRAATGRTPRPPTGATTCRPARRSAAASSIGAFISCGDDRARPKRREARLRPADGLAVADRDRAHRGAALPSSTAFTPDVDRLRREHQPGPAQAADPQVGAARRLRRPAIIDPPAGDPAKPGLGPDDDRAAAAACACDIGMEFGRGRRCGRTTSPARRRSAPGSAQSPSRRSTLVSTAGLSSDQRPPIEFAAAGDADPIGRDIGQRHHLERGAARPGQRRAHLARPVDQMCIGGEPGKRDAAGR